MIALGTIIAVLTIVAAVGVIVAAIVRIHTVETTSSLALRAVVEVGVAGTLAQISLLSFTFVWEKYRRWRNGAQLR